MEWDTTYTAEGDKVWCEVWKDIRHKWWFRISYKYSDQEFAEQEGFPTAKAAMKAAEQWVTDHQEQLKKLR